jgi:hypothetical protein
MMQPYDQQECDNVPGRVHAAAVRGILSDATRRASVDETPWSAGQPGHLL